MIATKADRRALVALTSLPRMGPRRMRALLLTDEPAAVLERLRRGSHRPTAALESAAGAEPVRALLERWSEAARHLDADALWTAHHDRGIRVLTPSDSAWPLTDDVDPPSVLFLLGDPELLRSGRDRVAIVGTRRCSAYGVEVASGLGFDLSAAGVAVVSGLAAGIDGAAHVGALRAATEVAGSPVAAPIGVAATGLDLPYPRHHRQLWRRVAEAGLLVSESPMGTPPTRWRFPARNRIIAALSQATVVVESAERGGSLHTVDEATRRDRPVLAVPGPITSATSIGTNRLIADGAAPACDAADVLLAIGRTTLVARGPRAAVERPPTDAERLLEDVGWEATTLDQVLLRSGLELGRAATLLEELRVGGWVRTDGGWIERCR